MLMICEISVWGLQMATETKWTSKKDTNQNKVNMIMLIRRLKKVTIKTAGIQPPSISEYSIFFSNKIQAK